MNNKISAVYKITNKITGECYVGSSKDVYRRWRHHTWETTWKERPNNRLYQDMAKYGIEQFEFQLIIEAEPANLKLLEQEYIEQLHPTYNRYRAKGLDKIEYDRKWFIEHKTEWNEYMRRYYQRKKLERQED